MDFRTRTFRGKYGQEILFWDEWRLDRRRGQYTGILEYLSQSVEWI
jgi:hypothetical protein